MKGEILVGWAQKSPELWIVSYRISFLKTYVIICERASSASLTPSRCHTRFPIRKCLPNGGDLRLALPPAGVGRLKVTDMGYIVSVGRAHHSSSTVSGFSHSQTNKTYKQNALGSKWWKPPHNQFAIDLYNTTWHMGNSFKIHLGCPIWMG